MSKKGDFDRIAREVREDDKTTFTFDEATIWGKELRNTHQSIVIRELVSRGLTMTERQTPKTVAGYTRNPHDRWQACPSHGGGGGSSIEGIAGRAG